MPIVSSVSKSDDFTFIFTGTGFQITDFIAQASYMSIQADTVTVDSDT